MRVLGGFPLLLKFMCLWKGLCLYLLVHHVRDSTSELIRISDCMLAVTVYVSRIQESLEGK